MVLGAWWPVVAVGARTVAERGGQVVGREEEERREGRKVRRGEVDDGAWKCTAAAWKWTAAARRDRKSVV